MNLRPTTPQSIIRRYYLYEVTASVGLITPIFTLFLLYRGLSFTQIGTLSAMLAVLIVFLVGGALVFAVEAPVDPTGEGKTVGSTGD